ncbi:MAG TPA: OprD family outer membrane porin, partial [Novosphingobium sp.]|nr:OprD family outer membrane porin [Novosphingobium sp.]
QLTHSQPIGDWTLGANIGWFDGKEDGSALAGDLDNRTWSGLFSAKIGSSPFPPRKRRRSPRRPMRSAPTMATTSRSAR